MLAEHGIEPIDLVCVDLYPFTSAAARRDRTEAEIVELIDVGGPTMLRAAAKNFAHVTAVSLAGAVRTGARRAAHARRGHARHPPQAGGRGFRDERRLRGGDRALVRRQRAVPGAADADACARSPTCPTARTRIRLPRSTSSRPGESICCPRVEQLGGKELSYNNLADLEGARRIVARARRAGRRDREAREPVRRGGRRHDRGGLGAGARGRPRLGVRLRRDPEPSGRRRARRGGSPSTSSRCSTRPGTTTRRSKRCRRETALRILADTERRGETPGERDLRARPRRPAAAGPRSRLGRARGDAGRLRRARRAPVGRPAVRLARLQARLLERDRGREGPADDRDRRGSDEPGRRGQDRARERRAPRPRPHRRVTRERRVLPVPGRARSSRSRPV